MGELAKKTKGVKAANEQRKHFQKKFSRLNKLSDKMWDELNERLRGGHSPWKIAEDFQKRGVQTDVSHHGLGRLFQRYREEHIPDMELAEQIDGQLHKHLERRVKNRLNLMDEIESMIALQWKRVEMIWEQEQKVGMTLRANDKNLELLNKMLKDYGDLGVKVGIAKRMFAGDNGNTRTKKLTALGLLVDDPEMKSAFALVIDNLEAEVRENAEKETAVIEGEVVEPS